MITVNTLPSDYRWATYCEEQGLAPVVDAILVNNMIPGWVDMAVPLALPFHCEDCVGDGVYR